MRLDSIEKEDGVDFADNILEFCGMNVRFDALVIVYSGQVASIFVPVVVSMAVATFLGW
jgi:hypothetical protein